MTKIIGFQDSSHRQEIASSYCFGDILDIGYAQIPNLYLKGNVTGLDIVAPKKKPDNYSAVVEGDANDMVALFGDNSFNTIIALEFIEHIDNHISFFNNAYRMLKPNGRLVISTPNPYYYRTMIGNIFFPKGKSGVTDHVSIYIPRILNNIAEMSGFHLHTTVNLSKIPLPIISYQILYVYDKQPGQTL